MPAPSEPYQSLYQAGVEAARIGDRDGARRLFRAAITLDARQKKAWLALAQLETDPDKKARCYERVLKLDPDDPTASVYLAGVRRARQSRRRIPPIVISAALVTLVVVIIGALALLTRPQESGEMLPTEARLPSLTPEAPADALRRDVPEATAETAASSTPSPVEPTTAVPTATVRFAIVTDAAALTDTPTPTPTPVATDTPVSAAATTESAQLVNPTRTPTRRVIIPTATRTPTRTPTSTPDSAALFLEIEDNSVTSLPVQATATDVYAIDFNTPTPETEETFGEDPFSGSGSPRVR